MDEQRRQHLNREFESFAQPNMGPEFAAAPPPEMLHHPQPISQQPQMHRPQPQAGDWAQEFSKLSLAPQNATGWAAEFRGAPMQQHHRQHVMQPAPAFNTQQNYMLDSQFRTTPELARQSEHRQQHHLHADAEAQNRAFEDAFSEIERQLTPQQPEVQKEPGVKKSEEQKEEARQENNDDDLSDVAKTIVDAVSDQSAAMSSHTSSKLKNSNFMALMQKLSDKQVVLQGEEFVATEAESKPASAADPAGTEARLPDPFEYIQQQYAQDINEENDVKPNVLSPLEYAQAFGPDGLAKRFNWEEKYHEDEMWTL